MAALDAALSPSMWAIAASSLRMRVSRSESRALLLLDAPHGDFLALDDRTGLFGGGAPPLVVALGDQACGAQLLETVFVGGVESGRAAAWRSRRVKLLTALRARPAG
jgi:hypothetical protein